MRSFLIIQLGHFMDCKNDIANENNSNDLAAALLYVHTTHNLQFSWVKCLKTCILSTVHQGAPLVV